MKNKLLLASVATITLTSVANATNYTITYNTTDDIVVNGQNFNSFMSITNYLNQSFDETNDKILFDATQPQLTRDILSNSNLRNDVIKTLSVAYQVDLTDQQVTQISDSINEINTILSGQSVENLNQIISLLDLNSIFKGPDESLKNVYRYMQGLNFSVEDKARLREFGQTINNFVAGIEAESDYRKINKKVINTFTKSSLDQNIKDILIEYTATIKKAKSENNSSEETLSMIAAIEETLKNVDFSAVRNSAQAQEDIKDIQKITEDDDSADASEALVLFKKLQDLYLVTDIKDATTVPTVQRSDSAITESMMNSLMISGETINSRINSFSAVAAGDLMDTKGIWVQGSYTTGQQKAYGNAPGYTLHQKGMTIGGDVGDENILGLAYSFNINDIKDKISNKNKTDLTSHIATIYGKLDISNEVFMKGQGQFGKSYVKKERNTGDLANNIAKAKTNATISSAKIEVGYDAALDTCLHLIPTVGLSYVNVDIKGYNETGEGLNRKIGKRTSNKTSAIAGVSAVYNIEVNSDTKLLPEVHANLNYAFKTKNSATMVTIIKGIDPIATPSEKLAKTYYNMGGSIKSIYNNNFEIAVGYDLGLSKKFQSHTGSLKLRVNM